MIPSPKKYNPPNESILPLESGLAVVRPIADARLAKLCFMGVWPGRPLEALEPCFWASKIRVILGCGLEAPYPSPGYRGFGAIFAGHHQLGLRFCLLDTSTCLGFWRVLELPVRGVKNEVEGPNRPHDAPGSWETSGT